MKGTPQGLTDKYWRKSGGEWHCFQKLAQVPGYVSLCQRREIALVLGQQIARPEAHLRCGLCDGLEMARRDGTAQVRFRPGGPEASVDDEGGLEEQPDHEGRGVVIRGDGCELGNKSGWYQPFAIGLSTFHDFKSRTRLALHAPASTPEFQHNIGARY
jgi:hypothetical protein